MEITVSHSELAQLNDCERAYKYYRLDRIAPRKKGIALYIGSATHKYIECRRNGLNDEQATTNLRKVFEDAKNEAPWTKEDLVKMEIEMGRALAMGQAYCDIYHEKDQLEYPHIQTEKELSRRLCDGVTYRGFLDCLAQDAAGQWWIHDIKTASSAAVNPGYFDRVAFDSQVVGYVWLVAEYLGIMPAGVIYDVIVKTQHSRTQKENTAQFINRLRNIYRNEGVERELFIRHQVEIGPKRLKAWEKETAYKARYLRNKLMKDKTVWPKNTSACLKPWGACPYMSICATGQVSKLSFAKRQ